MPAATLMIALQRLRTPTAKLARVLKNGALNAEAQVSGDAAHAQAVQRGTAVGNSLAWRDLPGDRPCLGAVKAMLPGGKWPRLPNLIGRCLKNSENTRTALIL